MNLLTPVHLYTSHPRDQVIDWSGLVRTGLIPRFNVPPEVLIWGQRIFTYVTEDLLVDSGAWVYREAWATVLLDIPHPEETAAPAAAYDGPKLHATATGEPPAIDHWGSSAPQPINPVTGQHSDHWVLPEDARKKGHVRPIRFSYRHLKCGEVTKMGHAIAETYAKDPLYYGRTFCVQCKEYLPVAEFVWTDDGTRVGS